MKKKTIKNGRQKEPQGSKGLAASGDNGMNKDALKKENIVLFRGLKDVTNEDEQWLNKIKKEENELRTFELKIEDFFKNENGNLAFSFNQELNNPDDVDNFLENMLTFCNALPNVKIQKAFWLELVAMIETRLLDTDLMDDEIKMYKLLFSKAQIEKRKFEELSLIELDKSRNTADQGNKALIKIEPIRWTGKDSQIIYLIEQLRLHGFLQQATDTAKIIKDHFVDENDKEFKNIPQAWRNITNNKNGKCRKANLIDTIIVETIKKK